MSVYTRQVTHTFEVAGDIWAVLAFNAERIEIEETRKNGQEDTHFSDDVYLVDGKWKFDEYACETLKEVLQRRHSWKTRSLFR